MIVAGLDQATRSGAAALDGDRLIHAEAFRPQGKTDPEIFHGFRSWWRAFLIAHEVEHAAIEEPLRSDLERTQTIVSEGDAFGSSLRKIKKPMSTMATYLRLYGLRAHAIEVCHSLNISCREVNSATWRKAIYGSSKPPRGQGGSEWWKQKALDHCRLLGWPIASKDAAEAALLAEYLRCVLNPRLAGRADDLFRRSVA